jgi:flavodoxin
MNTLVLYDTSFQNTAQVAETVGLALQAYGRVRVETAAQVNSLAAAAFDLLVVGCPTQFRKATPVLLALLEGLPPDALKGKTAACFDTRYHMIGLMTGSAAGTLAHVLRKKGARLAARPASFFVAAREGPLEDGELRRARDWANKIARGAAG